MQDIAYLKYLIVLHPKCQVACCCPTPPAILFSLSASEEQELTSNLTDACSAGLYLPTSDIDLVVMDSGADDVKIALKALGNKLGNTGIATKIQVGPQTCLTTSKLKLQTLCDAVLHHDYTPGTACLHS